MIQSTIQLELLFNKIRKADQLTYTYSADQIAKLSYITLYYFVRSIYLNTFMILSILFEMLLQRTF